MDKHNSTAQMAAEPMSAFSYAEYRATYRKQERPRGSATFAERQALFRDARWRLEHGVPVGVLIRDVTRKLQIIDRRNGEVAR